MACAIHGVDAPCTRDTCAGYLNAAVTPRAPRRVPAPTPPPLPVVPEKSEPVDSVTTDEVVDVKAVHERAMSEGHA